MSILFQPISIGSMVVKNRFVRSATHDYYGNPDGTISEEEVRMYKSLAENDVGLIITAFAYIQHPLGKAMINQNAFYSDDFIDGYKKIVDTVHPYGTKLIIQLVHAGRQTSPVITEGQKPVAPSAVAREEKRMPRELTEEEILQIIEDFIAAIVRAEATGCDGVQIHIAHGYLLSSFISPYTNRREDKWGGSIENRARIIKEIINGAKRKLSSDLSILVKLNSTDGFAGPEYLALEDVIYIARMTEELGVAAIEVSGGIQEAKNSISDVNIKNPEQEAYFQEAARVIKENIGIPVILVGGLRSFDVMEEVINSGKADMVALSRPFIKEPDLVRKLRDVKGKAACVSCNACFNPKGLYCYYKGE
jgi:2,4-dienoyl-CoA reductase-like NADH-dependent reductase (Old Yellow Enzyme family)